MTDAVTFKLMTPDRDWLADQARREGISAGALVRRLIASYRLDIEADPTQTYTDPEGITMPRPKSGEFNRAAISPASPAGKKRKYTADRPLPESEKIRPLRVACPRCGTETWADADGAPRGHLRDAQPGDEIYSTDVPTKVTCDE